jgi:hypothetical protein
MGARLLQPAARCPGLRWEGPPGKNGVKMPRVTQAWKSNPDRSRYYRLRADKLEMENDRARRQYVEAKTIKKDLASFCGAIETKIRASNLNPAIKTELSEDLADCLSRLSLLTTNGQQRRKAKRR